MRVALAVFVLAAAAMAAAPDVARQWSAFKARHARTYASAAEESQRFAIFVSNLRRYLRGEQLVGVVDLELGY